MKMKLFSILLLCCLGLNAQTDSLVFTQFKHKNGSVSSEGYLRKGKPDGYWKTFDEQGNLISEGNRKDYMLDGIWKFYSNNKLVSEISYKNGKKDGVSKMYGEKEITVTPYVDDLISGERQILYLSGRIKQTTPFEKGLENGKEYDFAEDGTITGITEYRRGFIVNRQRINRKDQQGLKQGSWKFFYPNLIIQEEGNFLNDKKNGYFKTYDTLGNLLDVKKYVDGEIEVSSEEIANIEVKTEYYPGGQPRLVATYKNGALEGVAREYNEEGKVTKAYVFKEGKPIASGIVDERGRFQNDWKEFYPDGSVKSEGRYRNGKRTGKWRFYFPSGKLEQEGTYSREGEYEGEWIWYYENGEQHIIQNYLNGLADGNFVEYDENGTIISQGEYIEGEKHGSWIENTGKETSEGRYRNGERSGKWKTYLTKNSKSLSFEGSYIDGNPNGRHVYYQENGKILEEGNYSMGKRHGKWKKYDENGQVFVTITYKNDEEVRYDQTKTEVMIK